MSASKSLPPLLQPYLALPPETSLILLTSTLGCSINWLTARFLASRLQHSRTRDDETMEGEGESKEGKGAVLLVSWMRELKWWKGEVKRISGLDLTTLETHQFFKFIDLFNTPPQEDSKFASPLQKIEKTLSTFPPSSGPVTLILDSPDLLLTTSPHPASLSTFLLNLRSQTRIHDTVLSISADAPFLSAATLSLTSADNEGGSGSTPLETATAAFCVTQAHAARFVLSARELETGAARDVSGVLRLTRGGDWYDEDSEDEGEQNDGNGEAAGREVLYLVQRDGAVKVFGRGEGGV